MLVRVKATGVNPVETYLRSGNHAHAPNFHTRPARMRRALWNCWRRVTKLKPGDRVYTADSLTGTYAEYSLCDEIELGRLPDNVSFEQGAGIWTPYATSYRALFQKAKATRSETVLIHGASGGVGIAAVQWAKNAGLTVIGTASSTKAAALSATGCRPMSSTITDEGILDEIDEITAGHGVDVIIEMLANVNLEKDFDALAMFGRIVQSSAIAARSNSTPRSAMGKDAAIYGMSLFNSFAEAERDEIHARDL